jgi:hypothetical protein
MSKFELTFSTYKLDMPEDIEALFWTQFSVWWMTFSVCESGYVTSDDGMDLGHIEECLEEWKAIMDLTELVETIDLWV